MRANNYEEVISALKPHLIDYLNMRGVDARVKGKIHCLNPLHDDKNPSMSFFGGPNRDERCRCFSCHFSADIFSAAHILENRPLVGPGFVIDNLAYLAELFNIKIDISNITPEDVLLRDIGLLYQEAANYITNQPLNKVAAEEVKRRNWKPEICKSHGVGCLDSYENFIKYLVDKGFSDLTIEESSLARREVFNENRLIFTVTDAYSQPVGFISKNLSFEKDVVSTGSKYYVAPRSDIKLSSFHPSKHFVGLSDLNRIVKLPSEVYIVEGPADWLSMIHAGYPNVVALNGSLMSEEQLQNLIDHGFTNLILMLDGDKAGLDSTIRILDKIVAGRPVKIQVAQIMGEMDPDELYRNYGSEIMKGVPIVSPAFQWRLDQFDNITDPRQICDKAIPLILPESSSIIREDMIKTLALKTGFSIDSIKDEVHRQENTKLQVLYEQKLRLVDSLVNKVKRNPDEALISAYDVVAALESLEEESESSVFTPSSILDDLISFKVADEERELSGSGFKLDRLASLEMALDGDWRQGRVLAFGGAENTGKAQPLDAKILTPTGWKLMGELQIGDEVITNTGDSSKILKIFPQGEKEVYDVRFTDDTCTQCCDEHLWQTETYFGCDSYKLSSVKPLSEIRQTLKFGSKNLNNHQIPIVDPIQFNNNLSLPINPYILGVLLGDGDLGNTTPRFTSADPEIAEIISELLINSKCKLSVSKSNKQIKSYSIVKDTLKRNPRVRSCISEYIKELELFGIKSYEKFIPSKYLFSSIEDRIALLQGLMDTDGYLGKDKNGILSGCFYTTTSPQLRDDMLFLVRSLGGVSKFRSRITKYSYEGEKFDGRESYELRIFLPDTIKPFKLERKARNYIGCGSRKLYKRITSIEYAGKKECQCILIDSPSHLYVTDDFIVTHNTALMSQLALEVALNNEDTIVLVHTIDDMAIHYIRRWVTQLTNDLTGDITINKIGHPNYYVEKWPVENQNLVQIRQAAYQKLVDLFKNNRLMVRDAVHGDTISWTASWVRFVRNQFPDKKILVVCDNFHNFKDFPGTDERIRFKQIIDFMKIYLAQKLEATVLTTVEYTKLSPNEKPVNDSIAETKAIMYRTDFIGHLYSPGGAVTETNLDFFHRLDNGRKAPIVELIIGKNKISGVKDSLYMKFYPEQSRFEDIAKREVEDIVRENRSAITGEILLSSSWKGGQRVS